MVIGGTRFIYHADAPALSVPVSNHSDAFWLIDTHILRRPMAGTKAQGTSRHSWSRRHYLCFQRAGKHAAGGLYRRTATCGQGKPVYLEYRRDSSGKPEANRVQMAFRSALKLLYRPEGLVGDPQQAYRHLVWKLTLMARRCAIRRPITLRSFAARQ